MKCAVCGGDTAPEEERHYRWPWFVCGKACDESLKLKIEEIARQRQPRLYQAKDAGEELVLDPYVGDEYGIARLSLESRIQDDLTRHCRIDRLRERLAYLQIDPSLAAALICLADRAPGQNWVDVAINGNFYQVFHSGSARSNDFGQKTGYYWERVAEGWQEHRKDELSCRFISDGELKPPAYGDVAGASALSVIEHGSSAIGDK